MRMAVAVKGLGAFRAIKALERSHASAKPFMHASIHAQPAHRVEETTAGRLSDRSGATIRHDAIAVALIIWRATFIFDDNLWVVVASECLST